MNLTWTTSLRVFPKHCNHHEGMIFGGEMMAEMDLVAATAVSRFLYDSPEGVKDALTVGFDKGTFYKGAMSGDLVIFTATITGVGKKRVSVKVVAEKESMEPILKPTYDEATITDCETKATRKEIHMGFEQSHQMVRSKMAEAMFHFCAYDMKLKKGVEHGMTMPTHTAFCEQYEPESSIINAVYIFDTESHAVQYVNRANQTRKAKFCEQWTVEEFKLEHASLPLNPAVPDWDEPMKPLAHPLPFLLPKSLPPQPVCPAIAEIPDEYPTTYVNIEPDV